jgi:hypothetical protein
MVTDPALIDRWMAELDGALQQASARTRRDAAHAVYLKLLNVRDAQGPAGNVDLLEHVEAAIMKSRQLHDAFHAELQHELEWAGQNGGAND